MQEDVLTTYDVTVRRLPPQLVAAVRMHTSMATIGDDIAMGSRLVASALEARGRSAIGPAFLVFHGRIDDVAGGDVEICSPVATAFEGGGDVYGAVIPGSTVATTIHRGSYDEMAPAYAALMMWIAERGREPSGPPREYYLNEPETTKEDDLLTEIAFPIH